MKKICLSIVIYNEQDGLKKTLNKIFNYFQKRKLNYEFWIFDNNSSDNSRNIIKTNFSNKKIRYFKQKKNMGYAYNNYSAIKVPDADLYIIMDGDGQYDPKDIDRFLKMSSNYDLILGYRKKRKDPIFRILASKILNIFSNFIIKSDAVDINCGYKLLSKRLAKSIRFKYFYNYINPEIYVFAKKKGFPIANLSVKHYARKGGVSVFNGNINFAKNVFLMIRYLIKLRLNYAKKEKR